ncbi:MAG: HAMP domain-containing sensor histidine kinase [Bacteroidales bacterium]
MEIRKKLLLQFFAIVALILFITSLAIYFSYSRIRRGDFFDRLSSKATLVAQMLIDIDEIDAEVLKKIELNNPLSLPNQIIIIYDYQDHVIYSTDDEHSLNITTDLINEVRLKEDIRFIQNPFEILGHFYTSQYDRFVVFAAATDIFGLRKLKRLRIILLIVLSSSLIIVFFSGRMFANRALRPISSITAEMEAIGESNLDTRVSEGNGKDELARLAQTFNKMLARLEFAFKTEKNFIANASHELRNPLTMITGQMEVILMKARSNDEYRKTINSLLEDIKSLNYISNRLLLLAQATSEFSDAKFVLFRIDDTLWPARKEILKRNDNYQVRVNFSPAIDSDYKLMVMGNDQLLKTVMSNLIDNGCKYSEDHSCEVNINYENDHVIICVSDNGIGIPKEEINMIFQPFYRGRNAIGIRGHGIGLSLVEKIISLHKGKITVTSELNRGTQFTLFLQVHNPSGNL